MAVLQVTIAGATLLHLLHLLYQFALAYSGWRYVEVVLGGESFMPLSSGLQNAAWMMRGVPEERRTDSWPQPSRTRLRVKPRLLA